MSDAVRTALEARMSRGTYEYQSEFARKYFAQGREAGRREAYEESFREGWSHSVLVVLEARGIQVDEETRQRIAACKELAQLKRWIVQALSARSVQELFEPAIAEKKQRWTSPLGEAHPPRTTAGRQRRRS